MKAHLDPERIARQQHDGDVRATARFEGLYERKVARMTMSSLGFLRGSAPLFYQLLEARPELAGGPKGSGWLSGDLHLENFGAYRTDGHAADSRVSFGVNDFDEAVIGPWRIDVLRLTTSMILAARGLGIGGTSSTDVAFSLLRGYATAKKERAKLPVVASRLIEQVRLRTRKQLLDARTVSRHGKRFLAIGPRYREVPKKMIAEAENAFGAYVDAFVTKNPAEKQAFRVIDVAQRIAGTGSLGCLRFAILTEGKGGKDGAFLFDMKEEGQSAALAFGKAPKGDGAARVMAANQACLKDPPRMLGTSRVGKTSLFVRRLAPQEDKLDLSRATAADLVAVADFLGMCAGRAHDRSATERPKKPWSDADLETLLVHAVDLAGIHEGAYLAYCRLAGKKPNEPPRRRA